MVIDILIHIIFQVCLSLLVFWFVLIPNVNKSVNYVVKDIIDQNIEEDIFQSTYTVMLKDFLKQYLETKDQHAYEVNSKLKYISLFIITGVLFINFNIIYVFYCNTPIASILYECFVTFILVLVSQIIFINTVVNKYNFITYKDILSYISEEIN